MLSLFKDREEVKVIEDQIGCPTSAWSLSRAILHMLPQLNEKITWGPQYSSGDRIFHWRDAGVASWYDLACAIQRYYKHQSSREFASIKCRIKPISTTEYPTAARRPRYSVLSTHKIQKIFGIEPRHWQDELASVLECGTKKLFY